MCEKMGVSARLNGLGGQFQVYFTNRNTDDYREVATASQERFLRFQKEMLRQRVLFMPITLFHHGISVAHTDEDVEAILAAMKAALRSVG
jgi:glutamate-1-semialdehyde 2,1-aminomutase